MAANLLVLYQNETGFFITVFKKRAIGTKDMVLKKQRLGNVIRLHATAILSENQLEAVQVSKKNFSQESFQVFILQAIQKIKNM